MEKMTESAAFLRFKKYLESAEEASRRNSFQYVSKFYCFITEGRPWFPFLKDRSALGFFEKLAGNETNPYCRRELEGLIERINVLKSKHHLDRTEKIIKTIAFLTVVVGVSYMAGQSGGSQRITNAVSSLFSWLPELNKQEVAENQPNKQEVEVAENQPNKQEVEVAEDPPNKQEVAENLPNKQTRSSRESTKQEVMENPVLQRLIKQKLLRRLIKQKLLQRLRQTPSSERA